jgi:putative FmdB family regulatory protein
MPVYVYRNLRTGETFEVEQRITESAWTEHPESGDPVKRLVQPVGIAFKGSGFYVTDSRGGAKKGAATAKASDASSTPDAKGGDAKGGEAKSGEAKSGAGASLKAASTSGDA